MNDNRTQTLDEVRAFLAGCVAMEFSITDKAERYRGIEQTPGRFMHRSLGQAERGLALRNLQQLSGYSRPRVRRLVAQYETPGELEPSPGLSSTAHA